MGLSQYIITAFDCEHKGCEFDSHSLVQLAGVEIPPLTTLLVSRKLNGKERTECLNTRLYTIIVIIATKTV